MFSLVAAGELSTAASLPSRLLHEISGCSYERLTWSLEGLHTSSDERTATNGIGPMLSASYRTNATLYKDLPKTKEEAAQRGVEQFDGLQVSLQLGNETTRGTLSPIRYSVLNEYKRLRKELLAMSDNTGLETLHAENPFIIGSAVYIVAELEGTQYLFMQIKGNAAGKDEIHSAAAAGGISMKEFNRALSIGEIFQKAALRQLKEEIGLPLTPERLGSPSLFRRENATGTAAIGYIVRSLSGEEILEAYTKHVQERLISSSDDTARGFVLIPTDGIGTVLFESGNPQLTDRLEFRVTQNKAGLIVLDTPRGLRPAAQGFLSALSDEEFQRFVVHG